MVSDQPTRKVVKALTEAGFQKIRTAGSHSWWEKKGVGISVPDGHRTISAGVVRKVMKAIEEVQNG